MTTAGAEGVHMRMPDPIRAAVEDLHESARSARASLAVAESCTGGLVCGAITAKPGASDVLDRGFVTYSNAAKRDLLGVPEETLAAAGAVSGPTARAMAAGAHAHGPADWGLAITGIAGPSGGRPGKPVGTVYIGIATTQDGELSSQARRFRFDGDRDAIREQTARTAIDRLASVLRRWTR